MNNADMIKTNSWQAWIEAMRLKTLSGAVVPVLIAVSLAWVDGYFELIPMVICFLYALLMQVAANFINDLVDFMKGKDTAMRLGPKRACSEGWVTPKAMKKAIFITLFLACFIGLVLLYYAGWWIVSVGLLCVILAFMYTAGPYSLSYHGWGDLLVLICFGFIPVCSTYFLITNQLNVFVWLAGFICGLLIDTLLIVNNYRDREEDLKSGKRTIVVRFGAKFGGNMYLLVGGIASFCCLLFVFSDKIYAALLPQLYLLPHVLTWQQMKRINKGKDLNKILALTSRNMLLFALLLSLGLCLSRILN